MSEHPPHRAGEQLDAGRGPTKGCTAHRCPQILGRFLTQWVRHGDDDGFAVDGHVDQLGPPALSARKIRKSRLHCFLLLYHDTWSAREGVKYSTVAVVLWRASDWPVAWLSV